MRSTRAPSESTLRSLVLVLALALLATGVALAERGDDADRASKNGRAEGRVDGVAVVIEYGRPKVKGREIWGGLVPFDRVWRTGANEATTIEVGAAVLVEGEHLPAGRYGLFTVPGREGWTIVFNRVADQWGAFNYDASQDALRVDVEPRESDQTEELTFEIGDEGFVLQWADLEVPVSIEAAG